MPDKLHELNLQTVNRVADGSRVYSASGWNRWWIGGFLVHSKASRKKSNDEYIFNINPNSISASWEILTCGGLDSYYVLPQSLMQELDCAENRYIDSRHGYTVIHIDAWNDRVGFERGSRIDISEFRCAILRDLTGQG